MRIMKKIMFNAFDNYWINSLHCFYLELAGIGAQQVRRNPASFTEELPALEICFSLPIVFFLVNIPTTHM